MSTCGCNASSDYDPYIPPSGGGCGCGNSGCNGGCGHHNCCGPTTPCDNSVPETCAPLPVTTQAARLVVENDNACKRTLQTPLNSVLITGADGRPQWANGSSGDPICLPDLQEQTSDTVPGIIAPDEEGCLRIFRPLIGGANPSAQVLRGTNTGQVYWDADDAGFPTTCGIFYRNCDTDALATLTGTQGQVVGFDTNGTPVAQSINTGADPTQGLYIRCNAGGTITTVTAALLSLYNGSAWLTVNNINQTLGLGSTGLNGIDTGVAAVGTLYWIYVVYNPSASTLGTLASLNATSPTLPANYTYYRRVGALVTKSAVATEAIYFHQANEHWKCAQIGTSYPNGVIPNGSGFTAGLQTLTLGIPSNSVKKYRGEIAVSRNNADTSNIIWNVTMDSQVFTLPSLVIGAATASPFNPTFQFETISAPNLTDLLITASGTFGGTTTWSYALNGVEWNFVG